VSQVEEKVNLAVCITMTTNLMEPSHRSLQKTFNFGQFFCPTLKPEKGAKSP
jgi:hypothetical protein